VHLPFRHDRNGYQSRTRHNLTSTWSCKGNPVLRKLGCKQAMQGQFKISRSLDMKDPSAPGSWKSQLCRVSRTDCMASRGTAHCSPQAMQNRASFNVRGPENQAMRGAGISSGHVPSDFRGPSKPPVANNNARPVTALCYKMRTRLGPGQGYH
jgi:hypothetical protein